MLIFFCAGRTSDMADHNQGAMDPSGEEKLDSSYDADDDGPDARLRRRERRRKLQPSIRRARRTTRPSWMRPTRTIWTRARPARHHGAL